MDEHVNKLECLLDDIRKEVEKRLYIESINIADVDKTMIEWQKKGLSKEHTAIFRNYIVTENSQENIKLFHETTVKKLKLLLTVALDNLNKIPLYKKTISNASLNSVAPNQEFKDLVAKGLISTEQEIFGHFKKQTFLGYLTHEGFFNLRINDTYIACPDFKQATLLAWGKVIPNDGWKIWSAVESKSGKTRTLEYFRFQLRKLY